MTKHILLIDDNPDDLEFYANILNHLDEEYQIHTAESYDEAIPLFNSHDIYCTFIDYNLPPEQLEAVISKTVDWAENLNKKQLGLV